MNKDDSDDGYDDDQDGKDGDHDDVSDKNAIIVDRGGDDDGPWWLLRWLWG